MSDHNGARSCVICAVTLSSRSQYCPRCANYLGQRRCVHVTRLGVKGAKLCGRAAVTDQDNYPLCASHRDGSGPIQDLDAMKEAVERHTASQVLSQIEARITNITQHLVGLLLDLDEGQLVRLPVAVREAVRHLRGAVVERVAAHEAEEMLHASQDDLPDIPLRFVRE